MAGSGFAHCPIFPTAASRRSLDRVSVPVWLFILSDQLPVVGLVGRYPNQLPDGPQAHPQARASMERPPFPTRFENLADVCGISNPFGLLSPAEGQIIHVLRTRPPLYWGRSPFSLDLHVLGAPLTFVLSQDQTLQLNPALFGNALRYLCDFTHPEHCASSPSTEDPDPRFLGNPNCPIESCDESHCRDYWLSTPDVTVRHEACTPIA